MAQNISIKEYKIFFFVFLSAKRYIKYFSGSTETFSWKYNGMLKENIENITTLNYVFAATLLNYRI